MALDVPKQFNLLVISLIKTWTKNRLLSFFCRHKKFISEQKTNLPLIIIFRKLEVMNPFNLKVRLNFKARFKKSTQLGVQMANFINS